MGSNAWHLHWDVRGEGEDRRLHYRLFCVLDVFAENGDRPLLTVIDADSKPNGEVFAESRYVQLSAL